LYIISIDKNFAAIGISSVSNSLYVSKSIYILSDAHVFKVKDRRAGEMTEIRDPVHGYVKLEGLALELADTPQMQRLRWIKQLGLANLVYPGANHTIWQKCWPITWG
jgi:hypothetical protein